MESEIGSGTVVTEEDSSANSVSSENECNVAARKIIGRIKEKQYEKWMKSKKFQPSRTHSEDLVYF